MIFTYGDVLVISDIKALKTSENVMSKARKIAVRLCRLHK